jgi:hypothetical protein
MLTSRLNRIFLPEQFEQRGTCVGRELCFGLLTRYVRRAGIVFRPSDARALFRMLQERHGTHDSCSLRRLLRPSRVLS